MSRGLGAKSSISIELKNGACHLKEHAKFSIFAKFGSYCRDGNLLLTALAIEQVPSINATKSLGFCTCPTSFDTRLGKWASAYFQPCIIWF